MAQDAAKRFAAVAALPAGAAVTRVFPESDYFRRLRGTLSDQYLSVLQVDPSRLAAECDRVVYNMDVQYRLLGGRSLSTPEGFCAVLIDMVLPIAEEPECMRFLEDIMHAHFEFLGTKHAWPTIIKEKHFDEAFIWNRI